MITKLVAGLGNPDARYQLTRHNAGFWLIDAIAAEGDIALKSKARFSSWVGEGVFRGDRLILVKPKLFMNNSGPPLRRVLDYFKISPEEILVAVDDVNLPLGRIRIRLAGGAGGHHGLESVIEALGTREFPRLRIGIGGGERQDLVGHVLARINESEKKTYQEVIARALEAVKTVMTDGLEQTMNLFNSVPGKGEEEPKKEE